MSDASAGHIVDTASNGDLFISPPKGQDAEVGERFLVLDQSGERIAVIKVVRSDSTGVVARYFQPFVSDDALRNTKVAAMAGAAGAAAAGLIGSALFPAVGTVVGAAAGAFLANALERRPPRRPIRSGMTIVPIAGSK
jgi:phage tail tape-measure protein